jgi:hypothetical protein
MKGISSNKGWHQKWSYLRNDTNMPLPPYTGRYFEVALVQWGYGAITVEKEKINTLLQAVKHLVNQDVTGARVITAFHERRVLPLMWWARQLDEMVLNTPLEGTMLMMEELDHEEIKKHIKSVLGNVSFDATLNLHQPMCPDDGFIEMVSAPPLFPLGFLCFLSID